MRGKYGCSWLLAVVLAVARMVNCCQVEAVAGPVNCSSQVPLKCSFPHMRFQSGLAVRQ